jgi:hypothetical protein
MPDLGKKYECFHCHTKFYNLGKPDPICPKCGANQKNAKSDEAPPPPRPARRTLLETIPDENPPEFGEEGPAEPPEEADLDDDELEEGAEPREAEEEEEEVY